MVDDWNDYRSNAVCKEDLRRAFSINLYENN